jgi:hypothetical protein
MLTVPEIDTNHLQQRLDDLLVRARDKATTAESAFRDMVISLSEKIRSNCQASLDMHMV